MCYKSFQSVAPVSAGFMHAFIVIKRIRRLFQNLPKTILRQEKSVANARCMQYLWTQWEAGTQTRRIDRTAETNTMR